MYNIRIVLALILGFGISSFVYELKKGNPPVKVYREGDAIINVWENKNQEGKTYYSYQVQKEYVKDGEKKYTPNFYKNEVKDLKKVVDQLIIDIEAEK
jgi:hypothetical protein